MGFLYEKMMRPVLFRNDPEQTHARAVRLLRRVSDAGWLCRQLAKVTQRSGAAPVEVAGLRFSNLVGLAAGMDKDAEFVPASFALGFGHVEVGTVTPEAQPGNPPPRLFRYPDREALVNRMGFNNEGAEAMKARLAALPPPGKRAGVVGVNIGKARETPLEEAEQDYLASFRVLRSVADYFTLNVSSPNTAGLRGLQERGQLERLLGALAAERDQDCEGRRIPLFVKIAPDLSYREVSAVLEAVEASGFDGVVATNTTIHRPGCPEITETGGLSGRPLGRASTNLIRFLAREADGSIPIIGVGGIMDCATAGEKFDVGASLVQLYTGWIYRGPWFASELARGLRRYQGGLW